MWKYWLFQHWIGYLRVLRSELVRSIRLLWLTITFMRCSYSHYNTFRKSHARCVRTHYHREIYHCDKHENYWLDHGFHL